MYEVEHYLRDIEELFSNVALTREQCECFEADRAAEFVPFPEKEMVHLKQRDRHGK